MIIEPLLPFLAGLCVGAAVAYIVLRKTTVSGSVVQQILITLAKLYTCLADDGKISAAERALLADEVHTLINLLKTENKEDH